MQTPLITFENLQAIERLKDTDTLSPEDYKAVMALASGKSWGEYYTPSCIAQLLANIIAVHNTSIQSVYDPTCGTGSLLLAVDAEKYYGQEINPLSHKICMCNMTGKDCDIALGDTLTDPKHTGPFDAVVSNPPYSVAWTPPENDARFIPAGVTAPKSKGDLAFAMHSLSVLNGSGIAVMVMFPGVLYRSGAEQKIRQYLVEHNFVDAVIALPERLFMTTQIAVAVLVLRKGRKDTDIFFMNAAGECNIGKQNIMTEQHISIITEAYANRLTHAGSSSASALVPAGKVRENGYNLSANSYAQLVKPQENINIYELEEQLLENHLATVKKMRQLQLEAPSHIAGPALQAYLRLFSSAIESALTEAILNGVKYIHIDKDGDNE